MMQKPNYNFKTITAIVIFCGFWLFTAAIIINKKWIQKKTSSASWIYTQTFSQNWNFFTQPSLYNHKLIVVVKNKNFITTDSVDVLQMLWQEKRTKFNYARANTWDHMLLKNLNKIREKIQTNSFYKLENLKGKPLAVLACEENEIILKNLNTFIKEQLQENNINTRGLSYQYFLYSKNIIPINKQKVYQNDSLIYTSPIFENKLWEN